MANAFSLSARRLLLLAAAALAAFAAMFLSLRMEPATGQGQDPAVVGSWSAPFELGVKGIHSSVLPSGKVLLFSYPVKAVGSDARVWDPASGSTTDVSLGWNRDIFCAGHSLLPNGRLLLTGGHVYGGAYGLGVKNTDIYDPSTGSFSSGPLLTEERWYPTNVTLGSGRVLIFGGFKDTKTGAKAMTVDSYDPVSNTITTLPSTANKGFGNYPKLHLLADGRIAWTNLARTQLFNPATNAWSASALTNYGGRGESGSSVLLPGMNKVLVFGGPNATTGATATAEIGDFSTSTPSWRYTGSMNAARVWANGVLLPDGKVLAVGGGGGGTYTNPVRQAELFDPQSETWTTMAAQQAPRVYHSTAVLLPDGRVLSAGHDNGTMQTTAEIYSPPYLFKGPRPSITAAPSSIGYGERFSVTTSDASSIARVALIRPSSTTHSLHQDQRYIDLSFTASDGNTLSVRGPANGTEAPPGPYMLFLLSSSGVPSVASFVDVSDAAQTPPAPAITSFSPTSGEVGSVVEVTGTNFTGASAVTFNGVAAQFSVVSDTRITATVPMGAATGRIRVTTAGGTATSAQDFTVIAPPPASSPYRDAVLADGPVGYWRLSETSGKALDVTGNAVGGSYVGGVTRGVPGALASEADLAARFNGVDGYVSVPDNNALDVGDVFTYELWVKRGATQGVTQRLLHKGAGPASLGFGSNNKVVLLPGGTGASTTASSTIAITDQSWHHVVATKNGSDTHIYIDGVDRTALGTNTTMTANATALNLARASSGSGYTAGDLDEVAIYRTALTPERVQAHYRAGTG
jgi:galactose oxidase-like protein/concanavalin A-like lectin/glucanase superfamily protein/IPT/TIG domain-containing protein